MANRCYLLVRLINNETSIETLNRKTKRKKAMGNLNNNKMELTKEDLQKAFEQGERFDYRPSWHKCFNRWYNENYLDKDKCNGCEFSEPKKYRNCKTCVEFSNFKAK